MISANLELTPGWLQGNREFTQPLRDFWDNSRKSASDKAFGQALVNAVIAEQINEVQGLQILFYINENPSLNDEIIANIISAIEITNDIDSVFLFFADCRSFEFANVIGSGLNAAATTNINESFFADHTVVNGTMRRTIVAHIDIATFTLPSFLRPGIAANSTAIAVTAANMKTQQWFSLNTGASELQIEIQWEINLKEAMRNIGGSVDIGKNTYGIRSPAPYLFTFTPTSCD